ncbi:MAG: hypothetical protein ACR2NA_04230 [Solirubrobacterales bacterium]
MRKLIVIPSQRVFRDFVGTGAFSSIENEQTYYLSPPIEEGPPLETLLDDRVHYLPPVPVDQARRRAYAEIRTRLLTSYRFRSRTVRIKMREMPWGDRLRATWRALPGIRHRAIRRLLDETGIDPRVHEMVTEVDPDIVIVISRGPSGEVLVVDATRSAQVLGKPVLALPYNWDNLSSKNAFAIKPDYFGAIGLQSAEHAERIHKLDPARTRVLGSPYIDRYFRMPAGATARPFHFPYVLYTGCYRAFDEKRSLELLDRAITDHGLDLTIVYLPHPARERRKRPDFVDDTRLKNVIVEPHIRPDYLATWELRDGVPTARDGRAASRSLPLERYPPLLEHAKFVVSPLSTMMLEAAIFRRTVLVVAHHDGLHRTSPGYTVKYLHYEGVDDVDGFEVCREESQMTSMFVELAQRELPDRQPPKHQLDYWLYHDERTFAERLGEFVDDIMRDASDNGPGGRPQPGAQESVPSTANVVK